MAAVTIGTLQLQGSTAPTVSVVTFGATVAAGDGLYLDSGTLKYGPAVNSAATNAACVAIALTGGASDERGVILTAGNLDLGATLTVGESYYVGDTTGDIVPYADLGSGDYVTLIGVAVAADELKTVFAASGVAKP